MTKRFKIEPDLTCPELAGYKLPEVERTPIAIDVEMKCGRCYMPLSEDDCWSAKECCHGSEGYPDIPATNPDGTVKGVYVYE